MATNPAAWTADANEALRLSLVRTPEDKAALSTREAYEGFHPTFTYPIFGEDEKIYGYKGLTTDLKFASGSLAQLLTISYSERLPPSAAVDDVEGTLSQFIPPGYDTDPKAFAARVEADAISFKPPGERIYSYSRPARQRGWAPSKGKDRASEPGSLENDEEEDVVEFEVYHSTWSTPGFREYHRRMQLFVLLYIEGASYIQEDEDAWEFAVLYEKRTLKKPDGTSRVTYHFVGYSTLYPFFCFPDRVRLRIAQFLILPPYQQEGHGSALYNALYQHVRRSQHVAELTVEDPAEAFEDLRDRNDLMMLRNEERFMKEAFGDEEEHPDEDTLADVIKGDIGADGGMLRQRRGMLDPPVDKAWAEAWRVELKLAGRQFNRLLEMLQLQRLDQDDARAHKAYRLQVKERLYRFNYEILAQLDKKECHQKLEETFRTVCADYQRILALVH
ncbi:histone acetyltransferase type B [Obba rivulosa]|uniref:Histone acetyltransferase type B catalytic subunit n=1 Tax=Obba rivulosa TaxID=1052685 RepID=A0A8E2ATW4_9APHY|nr:histone acetyltransferase type B [Obba rivulosa]